MAVSGEVMKFNLKVTENRFAREIVFLCLYIVMVYPIAGFIDLLIVNSIEFWSGENPVSGQPRLAQAGDTRTMEAADGSVGTTTLLADGTIDVVVTTPEGETHRLNLAREDGGVVARDANLDTFARVENGQVVAVGAK
jgi:hypothetical protein